MTISLPQRLLDLIAPRQCDICDTRLGPEEHDLCMSCLLHLPHTDHLRHPYDNDLAKMFWGRIAHIERAAAWMYHQAGSQALRPLYQLKYNHRPENGRALGRIIGKELVERGFLEGIDCIVPVPLAPKRQRQRGYNQSEVIARGISEVSAIPVVTDAVRRTTFAGSQTDKGRWGRNENVEGVFVAGKCDKIRNSHVLIVDDTVTTGATICACARPLEQAGAKAISVATVTFADPRR